MVEGYERNGQPGVVLKLVQGLGWIPPKLTEAATDWTGGSGAHGVDEAHLMPVDLEAADARRGARRLHVQALGEAQLDERLLLVHLRLGVSLLEGRAEEGVLARHQRGHAERDREAG